MWLIKKLLTKFSINFFEYENLKKFLKNYELTN